MSEWRPDPDGRPLMVRKPTEEERYRDTIGQGMPIDEITRPMTNRELERYRDHMKRAAAAAYRSWQGKVG